MNRKFHFFKFAPSMLVALAGLSALVMLLWNALVPAIFGLTVINFWQALGLLILCRILLFNGFGGDWHRLGHRNHLRERWQNMSPEERSRFIHRHHHPFDDDFRHDFFDKEEPEKKE